MTTTAGIDAGGEPFAAALAGALDAVRRCAELVSWQTSGPAVLHGVREVAALRGAVEALYLSLVREVDGRGLAASAPVATTSEGFLRTAVLVGAAQARRDVAAARATAPGRPLEPFAADLADGRGTRAHVDVAVRCLDRLPVSLLERPGASASVVGYLRTAADGAGPLDMDRAAQQLLARLDPDGSALRDRFDPDAHTRRFLDVHTDATGMVVGAFQLDPVSGATLRAALEQGSGPVAGADGEPDRRRPRQRRADALVALAETALGVAVPRRGERPRVVVHVTPAQLAGGSAGLARVEGDGPVSRRTAARLTCDAVLQRVVTTPTLGPLDVGREHRLVTLAQRRALAVRDGGCVVPGCGAPPDWCDAHHVVHWADGGPSDLSNYALLCPGHHTAVHAGTWRVEMVEGRVVVTPPRWVDPSRTPRPARHQAVEALLGSLDAAGTHDAPADGVRGDAVRGDGLRGDVADHGDDLFEGLPPVPRPVVGDDAVQRLLLAEAFRPSRRPTSVSSPAGRSALGPGASRGSASPQEPP